MMHFDFNAQDVARLADVTARAACQSQHDGLFEQAVVEHRLAASFYDALGYDDFADSHDQIANGLSRIMEAV